MRHKALLLSITLLLLVAPARPAAAQAVPPDEDWRQLTTEHFVVTYPDGLGELAARAAGSAERAYALLAERFVESPPGRVQLLLSDHADFSNGLASPFPYNRIIVLVRPPMDGGSLSYFDDWLELVITHELVHTFQLDMTGLAGKVIRAIFGRPPGTWPIFPSSSSPSWVLEGLATYFESELTGAGRVKGTWQEMVLRTAALEASFDRVDQVSGSSPVWPGGYRPYAYGAHYMDHMAGLHGEESLGDFARSVAGLVVPYRMSAAAHDAFGSGIGESWESWRRTSAEEYRALAARLAESAPITAGEKVEGAGRLARQAMTSPDGETLAFARADGVDAAQIRVSAPDGGGSRRLTRLNGVDGSLSWSPDGTLVFSQFEFTDPYRLTMDLYRVTRDGWVDRLTRGRRLTSADVAPDGERAIAVQEGGGTNRLVMVDLGTGDVTPLTEPDPRTHWAYPRWSPDGSRIAAVRWMAPGMMDIVILDTTGTVTTRVTNDRAVDTNPYWTPDGTMLLWSSDRTGIPNLFAATVPAGGDPEIRQVTNVLGGAMHPSVDPRGRWIHFSSYHYDGWHIERIPFAPEEWFTPQPLHERFAETAAPPAEAADITGDDGNYRALPTLRPYHWRPLFTAAEQGTSVVDSMRYTVFEPFIGLATEGEDIVGRHHYSLDARVSLDGKRFTGNFGYSYYGLVNPVLGLFGGQSHDARLRTDTVRVSGDRQEYFLMERERWTTLSASFQRARYRSVIGLALSGSLVREYLTLQDLQGEEGPQDFIPPRFHETDFTQLRATLSASTAQRRAFSVSREDGVGGWLSARTQREGGLESEMRGKRREDRSFQELTGEVSAYKGFRAGGFANHVLALRFSVGKGYGPGADRYHFGIGGAEGTPEALTGFGLFGGSARLLPVRGYPTDVRYGQVAWTASAEYRFPVLLIDRGLGPLPLFFDRFHGSVFFDAGNAWGPDLGESEPRYNNPKQDMLMSVGAEVSVIVVPAYQRGLTLRFGAGFPLVDTEIPVIEGDPVFYVRIGNAF
ncbi:MAG: BamA/TamA family outer membrane protein [Gemmatimonadota bacterium]|nr:BamA/TamA family outer membrane protein [Gemmatimonadota bacterium]MDE2873304.1 BamA/TamA family outer membrane protein [Gemmatimonadota bacterium]